MKQGYRLQIDQLYPLGSDFTVAEIILNESELWVIHIRRYFPERFHEGDSDINTRIAALWRPMILYDRVLQGTHSCKLYFTVSYVQEMLHCQLSIFMAYYIILTVTYRKNQGGLLASKKK
jgi:hypothetical protein